MTIAQISCIFNTMELEPGFWRYPKVPKNEKRKLSIVRIVKSMKNPIKSEII
jgi:hypothetical protein